MTNNYLYQLWHSSIKFIYMYIYMGTTRPQWDDCSDNILTIWCLNGKKVLEKMFMVSHPDSKVHGANMGPTWVLSAPGGPHVGPINLAIRDVHCPSFSNPYPHNLILLTMYILPIGIRLASLFNYCIMGIFDLTKVLVRLFTCHSYLIGVTTTKLQIWTWYSMNNPAFYNSENNGKIIEWRKFVCLPLHQIHYMNGNLRHAVSLGTCMLIVVGITALIARFMGPTRGPSGADRTQVGPMLAPWTLLSGSLLHSKQKFHFATNTSSQLS